MSSPGAEFVSVFLQEASEHLQFLREYSGILQDPYPVQDDIQRLYISAHTLEGTSASYGYPQFREIASKLSHIFQYAMNAVVAPDATAALVEFISEGIAVLESDLLMISANGVENEEEIAAFKQRYSFAFETPQSEPAPTEQYVAPVNLHKTAELPLAAQSSQIQPNAAVVAQGTATSPAATTEIPDLEPDGDVPAEILEFFVPEAEEHLQIVQQCLLSLDSSNDPELVNRLFRAMHTVKGSAAQVGLLRISHIAHKAEDLIGRVRDGELKASQGIVDLCLETVDVIKKFVYKQWPDEATLQTTVRALLARLAAAESLPASTTASPTKSEQTQHAASASAVSADRPTSTPSESPFVAESEPEPEFISGLRSKEPAALPQSKSVRIALERLDSMMNAVGELVINRTRMLGRLAELERLADVLNFSKARMSEKIEEFQEKHEFSRITGLGSNYSTNNDFSFGEPGDFSELEMDRYDDYNILSRSLTEISADVTEVLTQLDGFVRRVDSDIDEFTKLAHRLQDEITQARMVPIGNLYT
ncbi:MAG: Hpt domain-containing protein, partial [Acidobacteria bacterium]|nr:Hpt domain-containing protein [Acidobacteriota bacterium]